MRKTVTLFACLLLFAACSENHVHTNASDPDHPALHAIHDQELRDLMDKMNALMMERFMTEHEMDIERRRHASKIIAASKNLAATSERLLQKLPELGLDTAEQKAFRDLAGRLGQGAHTLQAQVENQSFKAISATLHDMQSTCLACHTLFRKL